MSTIGMPFRVYLDSPPHHTATMRQEGWGKHMLPLKCVKPNTAHLPSQGRVKHLPPSAYISELTAARD